MINVPILDTDEQVIGYVLLFEVPNPEFKLTPTWTEREDDTGSYALSYLRLVPHA